MDARVPVGHEPAPAPDAEEFVRFCYRRRRAAWPELYDEMVLVASRRLYRGLGYPELADLGIGFSLYETPRLAPLAIRVVREEEAARAQRSEHARRRARIAASLSLDGTGEAGNIPAAVPIDGTSTADESSTGVGEAGPPESRPIAMGARLA